MKCNDNTCSHRMPDDSVMQICAFNFERDDMAMRELHATVHVNLEL